MDHDDDGETSYKTFVDDVAFEPTYLQALLTAAGRNVATIAWATALSLSYRSILIQIFVVGFERRMCFEIECIMALQDHPRSLILAPIESAYAASY